MKRYLVIPVLALSLIGCAPTVQQDSPKRNFIPAQTNSPTPSPTPTPSVVPSTSPPTVRPTKSKKPTAKSPKPTKKSTTPSKPTRFKNCTEMRKYYPNGVPAGHPAYERKHDRDNDGRACER